MIVLDTNLVSELMRRTPDPSVEAWVAAYTVEDLFFSAVGEAELRYGAAIMPIGRRRDTLASDIETMLDEAFENRVLPFDSAAARSYAEIAARRRASGHPISQADGQIAAIAHSRGMAVATRNVPDFDGMGIEVINPWAGA